MLVIRPDKAPISAAHPSIACAQRIIGSGVYFGLRTYRGFCNITRVIRIWCRIHKAGSDLATFAQQAIDILQYGEQRVTNRGLPPRIFMLRALMGLSQILTMASHRSAIVRAPKPSVAHFQTRARSVSHGLLLLRVRNNVWGRRESTQAVERGGRAQWPQRPHAGWPCGQRGAHEGWTRGRGGGGRPHPRGSPPAPRHVPRSAQTLPARQRAGRGAQANGRRRQQSEVEGEGTARGRFLLGRRLGVRREL